MWEFHLVQCMAMHMSIKVAITEQNIHITRKTGSCITNLTKSVRKNAKNKYINSFLDTGNGQITKRLWSFIKNKRKDQCCIPPIHLNNTTITESHEKSNAFNGYVHQFSPKKT